MPTPEPLTYPPPRPIPPLQFHVSAPCCPIGAKGQALGQQVLGWPGEVAAAVVPLLTREAASAPPPVRRTSMQCWSWRSPCPTTTTSGPSTTQGDRDPPPPCASCVGAVCGAVCVVCGACGACMVEHAWWRWVCGHVGAQQPLTSPPCAVYRVPCTASFHVFRASWFLRRAPPSAPSAPEAGAGGGE